MNLQALAAAPRRASRSAQPLHPTRRPGVRQPVQGGRQLRNQPAHRLLQRHHRHVHAHRRRPLLTRQQRHHRPAHRHLQNGPDQSRSWVGLSDNVTYFVEQTDAADADELPLPGSSARIGAPDRRSTDYDPQTAGDPGTPTGRGPLLTLQAPRTLHDQQNSGVLHRTRPTLREQGAVVPGSAQNADMVMRHGQTGTTAGFIREAARPVGDQRGGPGPDGRRRRKWQTVRGGRRRRTGAGHPHRRPRRRPRRPSAGTFTELLEDWWSTKRAARWEDATAIRHRPDIERPPPPRPRPSAGRQPSAAD